MGSLFFSILSVFRKLTVPVVWPKHEKTKIGQRPLHRFLPVIQVRDDTAWNYDDDYGNEEEGLDFNTHRLSAYCLPGIILCAEDMLLNRYWFLP